MNFCERCGRPGPGGICPDCAGPPPPAETVSLPEATPPLPTAFLSSEPPQPTERGERRGNRVAGVVALTVFAVAVLVGGAMFASSLLRGDDPLAAEMVSTAPETPTRTPTPTPTVEASAPAPEVTVTVTASVEPGTGSGGPTDAATKKPTKKSKSVPEPRFDRFYPLSFGDQGYVVEALQRILSWRGVHTYVDGDFGNATERSVRQWQAKKGLSVTGAVDDTTWESMLPKLEKGSSGDAVAALQHLLSARGYALVVDGDFGKQTDRVVREFQRDRGLAVDGIVGPITWSALLS
jgi:peptidoglycan hydrolase-like protein with peptidoglycan-binding domain